MSTAFYNEVIEEYNRSEIDDILIVPIPDHIRFYNFKNVLAGRGLRLNVDLIVARQELDSEGRILPRGHRPAKIKKLTDTPGKIVDIQPAPGDDSPTHSSA